MIGVAGCCSLHRLSLTSLLEQRIIIGDISREMVSMLTGLKSSQLLRRLHIRQLHL